MKIYTIKDYPTYRIVEKSGMFYPESFINFFIFKWWTQMYVNGNVASMTRLDFAVDYIRKQIEKDGPSDKTEVEEISL